MTLGELKCSLNKISPDMNDAHVIIQIGVGGTSQYDLLMFVGRFGNENLQNAVILGTVEASRILVKEKKLKVPDDYIPGGEGEKNENP